MNRVIYKKIKESRKTYRIQVNIGKLFLSIVILEETKNEFNAYKTSLILEQHLKEQADQRGIEINKYYDKLIFFLENPEKAKFTFKSESLLIFEILNDNIRANYFHCDIHKVENFASFIGNFVDEIQEEILKSQENHFELSEKYNLIVREVEEYKTKLTELVERKNVDEQIMLSNFVSLLNEKKKRIQHLNELLEAFQINSSLANPVEVNLSYLNKRKRINIKNEEPSCSRFKEEVSDSSLSSNSDHYTTDNEKSEETLVKTTETFKVKSDVTVVDDTLDDIFEESPKPILILPNITREDSDLKSAATMIVNNSIKNGVGESKLAMGVSETEHKESSCSNTPSMHINTQDWLDRL